MWCLCRVFALLYRLRGGLSHEWAKFLTYLFWCCFVDASSCWLRWWCACYSRLSREVGGIHDPPNTPIGRDELALKRHRFFSDLLSAAQAAAEHRVRFNPLGPDISIAEDNSGKILEKRKWNNNFFFLYFLFIWNEPVSQICIFFQFKLFYYIIFLSNLRMFCLKINGYI